MRLMLRAAALLTCCSALTAASCGQQRVVTNLAPPPERLQCAPAPKRPQVPAEYRIDWARVLTVAQAKSEHERFVQTLRTRENVVTGYIIAIEGGLFICSENAAWLRRWYAETATP